MYHNETYRSGTVNSKSFIGKVLLRIKWKFELTVHFKHEMLGKWKKNISQQLRIKWNFELNVFELTVPDLYNTIDRLSNLSETITSYFQHYVWNVP